MDLFPQIIVQDGRGKEGAQGQSEACHLRVPLQSQGTETHRVGRQAVPRLSSRTPDTITWVGLGGKGSITWDGTFHQRGLDSLHPPPLLQEIDEYITQARDKSYETMMRVGKRGLNLAANAAVTAATKVMEGSGSGCGLLGLLPPSLSRRAFRRTLALSPPFSMSHNHHLLSSYSPLLLTL